MRETKLKLNFWNIRVSVEHDLTQCFLCMGGRVFRKRWTISPQLAKLLIDELGEH